MNDPATGRIAYPGLRPFDREEFDLFFGRENCVDEMVDTLAANRFLAVLGTSGSGKSSLVRTGLLNALELGFLASAGSDWQIADLRPRGHPIRSLAVALLALQGIPEPDEGEIEILSSFLRRGPRSLVEWYEAGHLPEGSNLVVLVDQFEELFRYQDYSGREEAEAFVALLIEAAREDRVPLYVVITMRSEYLGACTLIEGLPEIINRGLYLTPRMSRGECEQAIVGPAEVCGFSIEEGLVNNLLNDLTDFAPWEAESGHDQSRRLGRRADQLPLMQHVLNLLWQRARDRGDGTVVLALQDYETAGSLSGALDRHAEEVAAGIDPAHADAIDTVFRGLITGKTITDAVRRPTRFGELVALAGDRREAAAAVVDAFRAPGVNFLTPASPEPITDDTIIDISHESLIRQWQRLSRCLDEEAQSVEAWNQLLLQADRYAAGAGGLLTGLDLDNLVAWWGRAEPTEVWANRHGNNYNEVRRFLDESQRTETERQQRESEDQRKLIEAREQARSGARFKRLSGALAGAVVLVILGAGAAIFLWLEADRAREGAEQARMEAVLQAELTEEQRNEAEEQRALADAERERAQEQAAIADTERERAEEQATIADAERERAQEQAAIADTERERAEEQAAIAERERLEAEQARQAAEESADEARIAQASAARANARLLAQQLGTRINTLHTGIDKNPIDAAIAGSLLARAAAAAAYAPADSKASIEKQAAVELLRPALALQATLATTMIPQPDLPDLGDMSIWRDPPGGPGLTVLVNWSFLDEAKFLRILDPIGRIVARYPLPDVATSYEQTPIAAALIGPDIPAAVLAAGDGHIWAAFGVDGAFTRYTDSLAGETSRIDDVRYDPVGDRFYIVYVSEPSGGVTVESRLLVLERTSSDWSDWSKVADVQLGAAVTGSLSPSHIAGVFADDLYAVVDRELTAFDGDSFIYDGLGRVADARLTVDGRFVMVGSVADDCADPGAGSIDNPFAAEPDCLLLVDRRSGEILWSGEAPSRMRLASAYSSGGLDPVIEIVFATESRGDEAGWVPNDMGVLKLSRSDGLWSESRERFDPLEWGQAGFDDELAVLAATGTAYPTALTTDQVDQLFQARILLRLAGAFAAGETIIASRIDGDSVQVAEARGKDADAQVVARLYTPETGAFVLDEALTPDPVTCPSSADKRLGACQFTAAALSPDGGILLAATNYGQYAFLSGDGAERWFPNLVTDGSGRRLSSLSALAPFDREGVVFVATGPGNNLWRVTRPDQSVEAGRSSPSLRQIIIGETLLETIGEMEGFTTDPSNATLFVWGDNGVAVLSLVGADGVEANQIGWVESSAIAIADVAALDGGYFALAKTDGSVDAYGLDDGVAVLRDSVETGLSSFGALGLAVANGTIVANAGSSGGYWLRSVGFSVIDGHLTPLFAIPWESLAGQLSNGQLISTAFGAEVFATPPLLPDDEALLGLTMMREQTRSDDSASEFRPVFQMLGGGAGELSEERQPVSCGASAAVAARLADRERLDEALKVVRRACRGSDAGRLMADAAELEGRAEILGLLQLSEANPYAFELVKARFGDLAPDVVALLSAYEPWRARILAADDVADAAGGALADLRSVTLGPTSADPYDHWLQAVVAERRGIDADSLSEALFHYAVAERLFREARASVPPQIGARRAALARVLDDDVVVAVFNRLVETEMVTDGLDDADRMNGQGGSLEDLAVWLESVADSDVVGDSRTVLQALVEEGLGDAVVEHDAVVAAAHYRTALQRLAASTTSLAGRAGVAGRIDDVEGIRKKLAAAGADDADLLAATAILRLVDAERDEPITRDGELRSVVREAFEELASADAGQIDFDRFWSLQLAFLDYDWESRHQSIIGTSAVAFLDELSAAEAFAAALVDHGDADDRARWLALRGRLQFWMSTLIDEDSSRPDSGEFDRWLQAAVDDLEASEALETLPLWDRLILASAYSRMIERAPDMADTSSLLAGSSAAFDEILSSSGFESLPEYRRRLVFDGAMLALDREMTRISRDPLLSGRVSQPGEAGSGPTRLAELIRQGLSLAVRRETLQMQADDLGLVGGESGWSLDTSGDAYWGVIVAQAGALLAIESAANGQASECNRLTAHPYDVGRSGPAVRLADVDTDAALRACAGNSPRELFGRARALSKDGGSNELAVLGLLLLAAEAGLPVAYNNLSVPIREMDPDFVSPADLLRTFSALSLIQAYPAIADLLRPPTSDDEHAETFAWLATKAAGYDVPEAHMDLADLAGEDSVARAYHLSMAGRLFEDAGRSADADTASATLETLGLSNAEILEVEEAIEGHRPTELVTIDGELSDQILGLW
ncbi:MAG: hypothetical protein GY798_06670 [Hyphomicrobiales bacterium]|nr:hypothetical protein [Hyphomicrobiales bacterium]